MKVSALSALLIAVGLQLVSAGIVITKISQEQIVEKENGDCFFGVVTPQGCGYAKYLNFFSNHLLAQS